MNSYKQIVAEHVVPCVENPSSGVAQCVCGLCNGLAGVGVKVRLHSLVGCHPAVTKAIFDAKAAGNWSDDRVVSYEGLTYPSSRFPFPEFGRSPKMFKSLRECIDSCDIVHTHGMWMLTNIYPYWALKGKNRPLMVTSPHGVLTEYALRQSRWKKKIMWAIGQGAQLRRTDMFHATSAGECEDIRRLGFKQPVAIIRFGIDMPKMVVKSKDQGRMHTLMYLSRIHPDKRLDLLLDAWKLLANDFPEWKLDIYGPLAGAYPRQMIAYVQQNGLQRVSFKGEVLGAVKMRAYMDADLFILPTHTENFGLVVAEALACGTPAVVTKGAPWKGLEERRCGWWVDENVVSVKDCLTSAMSLSDVARLEMGARGRVWMSHEFGWDRCGRKMIEAYEWILRGGTPPDCISLN